MKVEREDVLACVERDQARAEQGTALEVEGPRRVGGEPALELGLPRLRGEVGEVDTLEPLYVRPSDAQLPARPLKLAT